jgi:hypothetical protein
MSSPGTPEDGCGSLVLAFLFIISFVVAIVILFGS